MVDLSNKLWCYHITHESMDAGEFVPVLVIAGETGYYPMAGQGDHAAPWRWGGDYDIAKKVAADENRRRGITEHLAALIVGSSMFPNPTAIAEAQTLAHALGVMPGQSAA